MVNSNQQFRKEALSNFLQGVKDANIEWRDIVEVVNSTTGEEHYDSFNAPGRVIEDLGQGFTPETGVSFQYDIVNNTYTLSTGVKKDALDDDLLGAFNNRVQAMGRRMSNFQFERAMTVLTTGDANTGFDGSNFFGNSHNDYDSLDNAFTSVAASGDAVPTLSEFETQFALLLAQFFESTDRSGSNIHYDRNNLILYVGPQLETVARKMLTVQLGTSGITQVHEGDATVRVLPVNHNQDTATVKECFLIKADNGQFMKPLILQERQAMTQETWENEQDRTMNFGTSMRFEVGFGNPAYAIHQVFTT